MKSSAAVRVALVGALLTVLVGLFVLSGAGIALSDPQERSTGETVTLTGTVVAEAPPTISLQDGRTLRLDDLSSEAVSEGQRISVDVTVHEAGAPPGVVEPEPWQRPFMYGVSALAGALVLGRIVDYWRFDVRRVWIEPRSRPLHESVLHRADGPGDSPDRSQYVEEPTEEARG